MQGVNVNKLRNSGRRNPHAQESILVSEQADKATATIIQYAAKLDFVNL